MSRPLIPSSFQSLPVDKQHAFLTNKKEDLFSSVNKLFDHSKAIRDVKGDSIKPYLDRLDSFESKFEELKEYIDLFNVMTDDLDLRIEISQVTSAFCELIDASKSNYLKHLSTSTEKSVSVKPSSDTQLSRINIPVFSGQIEEWSEFFSLFESLVDNNEQLSVISKFQYLKTSLRGEALSVISQFDFIPENYCLAIDALKRRYQNKRRLARVYLKRVMDFKTSGKPDYRQLLSVLESNWNALEKLGIPDLKDYLKLFLSIEKLDVGLRKRFDNEYGSNTFPTYKDLINYLTERVRVDEMYSTQSTSDVHKHDDRSQKSKTTSSNDRAKMYLVDSETQDSSEPNAQYRINKPPKPPSKPIPPSPVNTQAGNKSTPDPKASSKRSTPTTHTECWNCGGLHLYSQCREPRKLFCYRCGAKGVTVNNCTHCHSGNAKGAKRRGSL